MFQLSLLKKIIRYIKYFEKQIMRNAIILFKSIIMQYIHVTLSIFQSFNILIITFNKYKIEIKNNAVVENS